MIKNYFRTAWRNLWRNKVYAVISTLGLSIGLAVFLLVLLYINHEQSYDRWDKGLKHLYRVGVTERNQEGVEKSPSVQFPLGTFLANECPEVIRVSRVRVSGGETLVSVGQQQFYETKVIRADSNFFALFPYRFVGGSRGAALNQPNTAVITRTLSEKLFGKSNPIGQIIILNGQENFTITGVIAKPGPSHLDFNICLSYHSAHFADNWFMRNHDTYVRLDPKASLMQLTEKASKYYAAHYTAFYHTGNGDTERPTADPARWLAKKYGITDLGVFFEPVRDIHLKPIGFAEWSGQRPVYDFNPANQRPVTLFSFIALLILSLACVNYANMAIAQGSSRMKESGIRQVMGASRRQLIAHFLLESLLQCLIAVLLALGIVVVIKNMLNHTFQAELSLWNEFNPRQNGLLFVQLVGVLLLTALCSGLYPALVLARHRPAGVLKNSIVKTANGNLLRNGLIVFQYGIASCFVIGVLIIALQLRFMRQHDPGFDTDQVLRIEAVTTRLFPGQPDDRSAWITRELANLPGVVSASTGQIYPGQPYSSAIQTAEYGGGQLSMQFGLVNFDYFKVLGMNIVQGRDFSPMFARDTIDAAIVNETAARKMGWQEPIGKTLDFLGREYRIIGLVQDSHLSGYADEVLPQVYMMGVDNPQNFSGHQWAFVKTNGQDAQQTLKTATSFWKRLEPEFPVRYSWLDDDFAKLLEKHERFAFLVNWLTGTALLIAMMGSFALSLFTIRQRTKEIGIRKVLGASVSGIVGLLSKDFVKLILIAAVIASPIAWWAMNNWLEGFAYRIAIQWWMFAAAGLAAVVIALLTVSFQAVKAAVANPVDSLRDE